DDSQSLGDDADYPEGQVRRDRAASELFRRATLRPDQPDRARETKRRAPAGAQGARIHPATQERAVISDRRRAGLRRERVSFLQGLQEVHWPEVHGLSWPDAVGRRQNAAL